MSKLTDFRVLSFDVYGTLIDWDTGLMTALQPLFEANDYKGPQEDVLAAFNELEAKQQAETPGMLYKDLLATIHQQLAAKLGLARVPTDAESRAFGNSVGNWPAFPDTVEALRRLKKHYKLVVLSNVDLESFAATNAGPLEGLEFDLVLTAQEIGSYKPDQRNFAHMLGRVHDEFGATKEVVLQTANSQFHDCYPARAAGIKSCWIARRGVITGNLKQAVYDWKFDTLADMADAVEAEPKK